MPPVHTFKVSCHVSSTIKDRHGEVTVASGSFKDALLAAAFLDNAPEFGVYFDADGNECHSEDATTAFFDVDGASNIAFEVTRLPKYGTIDIADAYISFFNWGNI